MKYKFKNYAMFLGLCLVLVSSVFAQNKVKQPDQPNYYSLNPNGDASNPMLTSQQPAPKEVPEHVKDLLRRLNEARHNNNVAEKQQIEQELDQIYGGVSIPSTPGQGGLPDPVCTFSERSNPPFAPDYFTVPINTGSDPWCVTTCTNPAGFPNAGRIWCVYTGYSGSATDTLKVTYSDNNGATWTQYSAVNYGSSNVKFRSSELKAVPVNEGGTMFLFVVASYDFSGNHYSSVYRWNVTGSAFAAANLLFPGENFSFNPRMCTDNSNYSTNEYVYLLAAQDSVIGSGNSDIRQKYALITQPGAATLTVTYRGPGTYGGAFWWHTTVVTGTYLSSDIAYYKDTGGSGLDRIMAVWNVNYGAGVLNNLYLAWSDNYGVSNTSSLSLTTGAPTRGARIAFNAGANRDGMIAYYSLFSGSDWDYLSYNTTTGGGTTGAWTGISIDFSSFHASGHPDLIAEWGATNIFKAAYTEDLGSGPRGLYSGFNGTSWTAPAYLDCTGAGVDTTYTGINPGYKNGGGDDNIAFYSTVGGTGDVGIYCSNNISSTVGIQNNNNGVPKTYSLSQNYPNPFNPSTSIKFGLPKNSSVKLVIYDLTGRLVATLVDGQLNAGNYTYHFDASNIASGVYFYKLQSDDFTDVKKFMLVK